nr:EOG090X06SP [Lepidurus arcticus]
MSSLLNKVGTVVVLGGGISGLAAAYKLTKMSPAPSKILLLEASSRLGGWVHSTRHPDGIVYECGPRTIRPAGESGATTLSLVEDLGLQDQVLNIKSGHPTTMNRLIYVGGKLHPLPTNMRAVFKTVAPFQAPLISAVFRDLITKRSPEVDESMYSFVERRLGKDLAEFAIDPLVRGVCAGDAREISVNFLLKSLKDAEQKHGSVTWGLIRQALKPKDKTSVSAPESVLAKEAKSQRWAVWSLQGGLQTLPDTLAHKLSEDGVELYTESPCSGIEFRNGGQEAVVQVGNQEIMASQVVSTVPAAKLASLLAPQHPVLAKSLGSIPSVTVGLVNLEWDGPRLQQEAFGFLVPSTQKLPVLGIVYDSCSFPQDNKTILTVMMGGKWFHELFGPNPEPEQLLKIALQQIESVLGIKDAPVRSQVSILENCIPQYVIGHLERVKQSRQYIAEHRLNLHLAGASYDGPSVNDCIHYAYKAVEKMYGQK